MQEYNAKNARIRIKSILALYCTPISVNALCNVVLRTGLLTYLGVAGRGVMVHHIPPGGGDDGTFQGDPSPELQGNISQNSLGSVPTDTRIGIYMYMYMYMYVPTSITKVNISLIHSSSSLCNCTYMYSQSQRKLPFGKTGS